MVSFVERATLVLDDRASAPARKINAELARLAATARKLKGAGGKINISASGIDKTRSAVAALGKDLAKLQRSRSLPPVVVRVDSSQVQRALTRIAQLRLAASQQLPAIRAPASVPAIGGGRGGSTANAIAGRQLARGGAGGGVPQFAGNILAASRLIGGFTAVTAAAHLAAGALRSVASNASDRDRTALQAMTQASAAQRRILQRFAERPEGAGPIGFTKDERRRFQISLLGDVQGNEEERAIASGKITQTLERELLPRMFAQRPDSSREEILNGLRRVVQAMNLASTDIVDSQGNISKDGMRALEGIMKAQSADPDLTAQAIRTTLANAKTAGLSLDSDAIAKMLINAGSRGVRAANETFRAIKAASGTVDSKALNNSLASMGLLQGVARNKKGNVIAGSGTPVDERLLNTDPSVWFDKNFRPIMEKALRAEGKDVNNSADQIAFINKKFAGMSAAGIQGITDMILGFAQMRAAIDQANLAMKQSPSKALEDSWTAQAANVGAAWKDAAGDLGSRFMESIGAAGLFKSLAGVLRGEGGGGAQGALVAGGAVAGAAGLSLALRGLTLPLTGSATALTGSATALNGAAAALSRSALAQGARSVPSVPGVPGVPQTAPGGSRSPAGPSVRGGLTTSALTAGGIIGGLSMLGGAITDTARWITSSREENKAAADAQLAAMQANNDRLNEGASNILSKILPKFMADRLNGGQGLTPKAADLAAGRAAERSVAMPDQVAATAKTKAQKRFVEDLAESQEIKGEIARVTRQIEEQRARQKLPGTADMATAGLQNELAQLTARLGELTDRMKPFERQPAADAAKPTSVPQVSALAQQAAQKFVNDTAKLPESKTGNLASNALTAAKPLAEQAVNEKLTKKPELSSGMFSPESIGQSLTQATTQFQTTFQTGASELKAVAPAIDQSAAAFGPTAGAGLLGVASAWGAQAGAAIAAAVGSLSVNVNAPRGANTGTTVPGGV